MDDYWIYNDIIFCPSYEEIKHLEGFVYKIINTKENRVYIGKKSFKTRRKPKNAIRKKTEESDWKKYYSSCDELKDDVKRLGKENFRREILVLCKYKKQMSYWEQFYQWHYDVIMNEIFYNTNIAANFFRAEKYIYEWKENKELLDE